MANSAERAITPAAMEELAPSPSEFRRVLRVFFGRKLAMIGFAFIVVLVLTAIFAPLLAPHDPYKMNLANNLAGPSAIYPLGTD